ncbi:MAG: YwaF family protein [Bacillota bacterium]|nr:YwaF family protein [Bacillota bacterium]
MLEVGFVTTQYIIFTVLSALLIAAISIIASRMSRERAFSFTMGIAIANFALHFVKIFLYLDDMPGAIRHLLPENLCALSILIAPFVIKWGRGRMKDYFVLLSIVGGVAALIIPTTPSELSRGLANGSTTYSLAYCWLESIRYYICHILLAANGVMMLTSGIYRPDYRRSWSLPIYFTAALCIIALSELFGGLLGWYGEYEEVYELFSSTWAGNPAFAYGIRGDIPAIQWAQYLIPNFLKYTLPNGELAYVPGLWALVPAYLFAYPIYFLLIMPFEFPHLKGDLLAYKESRRAKIGSGGDDSNKKGD